MFEVDGEKYPEWSSFIAALRAELGEGDALAPARPDLPDRRPPPWTWWTEAEPRARAPRGRRAAPLSRALALVFALALPATLGPSEQPPLAAPASRAPGEPANTRGEARERLGVEPLQAAPTASDGRVEHVAARFARHLVGLDEHGQRHLARTLVDEAELARIDPLLVLAVIQVESSYDPGARSERGALGLMQLLEPTLRTEARRAGEVRANPLDPATNVKMGIRYLRRLLDAFGKQDLALMAYNAGPNRILGYLRGDGIPERYREYPRRVTAELRRLRRASPEARDKLQQRGSTQTRQAPALAPRAGDVLQPSTAR